MYHSQLKLGFFSILFLLFHTAVSSVLGSEIGEIVIEDQRSSSPHPD